GKIIGRQGRVAEAMRVLLRVRAVKDDTRANLEIV
ncbi:MAG: RNA-binding protein, partial [Chloroflexota bacterium]|nr:RNA-binding protein [Chloroflexota bacterium]